SAPNIELNSDGSATYNSGQFNIATYKRTAAGGGVQISLENGNGTTRTLSNDSSGHLFFGYAGANQAALTNSGNFQVGGTLTSAPNITLNSNGSITAAGSVSIGGTAAANTIDEYEVGSYTPAFNAGTYTYNFQIGSYVKIGKLVTVIFDLQVSSVSSASTGSIQISLPFANNNVGGGAIMYPNGVLSVVSGLANSKIANSIQTQNNTALVNVKLLNGTGSNNVGQYQDLQANSRISGSITYTTSG
ncbi:MAG: hypothetical protein GY918_08435, partial [Gammaproteobacteria bacterium]|nr:hypothetical protein [Gammaproteobacteria bacterium]